MGGWGSRYRQCQRQRRTVYPAASLDVEQPSCHSRARPPGTYQRLGPTLGQLLAPPARSRTPVCRGPPAPDEHFGDRRPGTSTTSTPAGKPRISPAGPNSSTRALLRRQRCARSYLSRTSIGAVRVYCHHQVAPSQRAFLGAKRPLTHRGSVVVVIVLGLGARPGLRGPRRCRTPGAPMRAAGAMAARAHAQGQGVTPCAAPGAWPCDCATASA